MSKLDLDKPFDFAIIMTTISKKKCDICVKKLPLLVIFKTTYVTQISVYNLIEYYLLSPLPSSWYLKELGDIPYVFLKTRL